MKEIWALWDEKNLLAFGTGRVREKNETFVGDLCEWRNPSKYSGISRILIIFQYLMLVDGMNGIKKSIVM